MSIGDDVGTLANIDYIDGDRKECVENFLFEVVTSKKYLDKKYLIFTISVCYLKYLCYNRHNNFKVPEYLEKLVNYVEIAFSKSNISVSEMIEYMLKYDLNGCIYFYDDCYFRPLPNREFKCDMKTFTHILTAYILDYFREGVIDIEQIVAEESLSYETNQYGLSNVNGVDFKEDYFLYDNKAYIYNILTNKEKIHFHDSMPGFAKIITEKINDGDILLRLDERLAIPINDTTFYSKQKFDKIHGPQFHFNNKFENKKTITVHINNVTSDKLLMVIKQDYDSKNNQSFLHIEIETLPYIENDYKGKRCITTFLHGMYYFYIDGFTHIDYTKNQYKIDDYRNKYSQSTEGIPIDFYAEKHLHYKIWCIENGFYSREVWYNLMVVSLTERYRILLDEILA